MLVHRIRPHLNKLISPYQNSFLPSRGSEIKFIITSEIIQYMSKKIGEKSFFALKLDLEKAYDLLEWSFIQETLSLVGLCKNSIQIIMYCITTPSFIIYCNGIPSPSFTYSRGIRPGIYL